MPIINITQLNVLNTIDPIAMNIVLATKAPIIPKVNARDCKFAGILKNWNMIIKTNRLSKHNAFSVIYAAKNNIPRSLFCSNDPSSKKNHKATNIDNVIQDKLQYSADLNLYTFPLDHKMSKSNTTTMNMLNITQVNIDSLIKQLLESYTLLLFHWEFLLLQFLLVFSPSLILREEILMKFC